MQARSIILLALTAVALVLLVSLAVASRGDRAAEIDQQALARAQALHQQRQVRAPAAASSPRREWRRPSRSPSPQRAPRRVPEPAAEVEEAAPEVALSLEDRMDEANALYDRADYIGAKEAALVILEEQPDNVRMLRIAVSVACMMGSVDEAHDYYGRLPERDQRQMARRCKKYGVEF